MKESPWERGNTEEAKELRECVDELEEVVRRVGAVSMVQDHLLSMLAELLERHESWKPTMPAHLIGQIENANLMIADLLKGVSATEASARHRARGEANRKEEGIE